MANNYFLNYYNNPNNKNKNSNKKMKLSHLVKIKPTSTPIPSSFQPLHRIDKVGTLHSTPLEVSFPLLILRFSLDRPLHSSHILHIG